MLYAAMVHRVPSKLRQEDLNLSVFSEDPTPVNIWVKPPCGVFRVNK